MSYIVSYTQSDYNGNSTSGTLSDIAYSSYSVSTFYANTLRPFQLTSSYTSTLTAISRFCFSEISFNESGGLFTNSHQGLTISVGLDPSIETASVISSYSGVSNLVTYSSISVDPPIVIYTSPTGNEYALPSADATRVSSSMSYNSLVFSANGHGSISVRKITSTNSATGLLSSSSKSETVLYNTGSTITSASMRAANYINMTYWTKAWYSYSLTFNLSSVSESSNAIVTSIGTYFTDGYTFRSSATGTSTLTTVVIDTNLSQVEVVEATKQSGVITSVGNVLYTGPLNNVLTDSSYTSSSSSTFNNNSMTGSVASLECNATYFVDTYLNYKTDTFRLDTVETTVETSTDWGNPASYLIEYSSYYASSVYTQSAIESISTIFSSLTKSSFSTLYAVNYDIETLSTSSSSQDYGSYYRTTSFSTLNSYYSNVEYSLTTYVTSTSSRTSRGSATTTSAVIDAYRISSSSNASYIGYTTYYLGSLMNATSTRTSWENVADVLTSTYIEYQGNDFYVDSAGWVTYKSSQFGISALGTAHFTTVTSLVSSSTLTNPLYHRSSSQTAINIHSSLESSGSVVKYLTSSYITEKTTYQSETFNEFNIFSYIYDREPFLEQITRTLSFSISSVITSTASESYVDTVNYGTTYRMSTTLSQDSYYSFINNQVRHFFNYTCEVNSIWDAGEPYISTISNYTTVLATNFTVAYNTVTEALSYSFTATQSNTVKTTGERFIDKIEIYRTSTVGVYGRNTVAVFSGSTLDTISSRVTTESAISTSQDVSTVDKTFITSSADFTTDTELVTQDTLSSVSNRFISSSSFMISSTYEQQNETLMFKTSWNKYSYYYNTSYYSTVDTIKLTISASTYESLYVPASFTTTSGYTSRSSTTGSYSSSTLVTSLSSYTTTWMPVYTTVDGVYITTE